MAHSLVFFSREEWLPVADAQANGFTSDEADESETNQQVGVETGGGAANTVGAGGTQSNGGTAVKGSITATKGGTIDISNPDPEAIAAMAYTSSTALDDMQNVAEGAENTAETAIGTVATNSTLLESVAAEYTQGLEDAETNSAVVANNATTGASEPVEYQTTSDTPDTSSTSKLEKIGVWVSIIAGVVALWFYLRKGKA